MVKCRPSWISSEVLVAAKGGMVDLAGGGTVVPGGLVSRGGIGIAAGGTASPTGRDNTMATATATATAMATTGRRRWRVDRCERAGRRGQSPVAKAEGGAAQVLVAGLEGCEDQLNRLLLGPRPTGETATQHDQSAHVGTGRCWAGCFGARQPAQDGLAGGIDENVFGSDSSVGQACLVEIRAGDPLVWPMRRTIPG